MSKQLVVLCEALPGVDLAEIVAKQPRLLQMEGAKEKVGEHQGDQVEATCVCPVLLGSRE